MELAHWKVMHTSHDCAVNRGDNLQGQPPDVCTAETVCQEGLVDIAHRSARLWVNEADYLHDIMEPSFQKRHPGSVCPKWFLFTVVFIE